MKRDFSLGEIAAYLDAELHGETDLRVRALNTLQDAQAGELAFLANEKYVAHLGESSAEAVILSQKHADVLMSGATSRFQTPPSQMKNWRMTVGKTEGRWEAFGVEDWTKLPQHDRKKKLPKASLNGWKPVKNLPRW